MDRAMTNAKNRFLPIFSSSLFRILFAEGSAAAILTAPGIQRRLPCLVPVSHQLQTLHTKGAGHTTPL